MDIQARQTAQYIEEMLAIEVVPVPWRGGDRLPPLLRERYRFAEVRLLQTPCLLMLDSDQGEPSPATVRKHTELAGQKADAVVIYVRLQVTAYNRKRLIKQKVPFIVPGNQMYLPMLGLDLREHFKRVRAKPRKLGPATQALVLHALLRPAGELLTPAGLARRLGYSAMTMTRAFDELEDVKLADITMHGRERCLRFEDDRRKTWETAEPLLRSPVSKRLFIRRIPFDIPVLVAGLAALARHSMLSPPEHPVHALGRQDWKAIRGRRRIDEVCEPDAETQEIEVWSYRPALLADDNQVDPLSLFLSLRDNRDERVEATLEAMMKALPW